MSAKITTILTSHNRPDSLVEAIKSVIGQSFKDWQLIIADDTPFGITRNRIKDIGESAAKADPRVIFMQNKPTDATEASGYAVQINKALKVAEGKLITYLCDDDLYVKDHYAICLKAFEKHKDADVVYSGILIESENGNQTVRYARAIKRCGFFTVDHTTVMHKKEIIDVVGPWSERLCHIRYGDAELWLRMAKAGYLMYPTNDVTCIKKLMKDSLNLYGGAKK